jgi:transcriptional regulator with XRE-family HTH domain
MGPMDSKPKTLKEIAQAASDNNGGARGRQLGRIAEKAGLTLSYTTVDKILAGTYTSRPSRKTLEALAQLSGAPVADVFEAAQEALPQARLADQLPPDVDTLTPEQRKVIIDIARVFLKENRTIHQLESRLAAGEEQDDYRLAAHEPDASIGHDQLPDET